MSREEWGAMSARLGPQLPPVKPGQFAPPILDPKCSRCGKRRKVARVTKTEIVRRECDEMDASYDEDGEGER